MKIRKSYVQRAVTFAFFVGLFVISVGFGGRGTAGAITTEFSWMDTADLSGQIRDDLPSLQGNTSEREKLDHRGCVTQKVYIGGVKTDGPESICIYQANGFRYGVMDRWVTRGWFTRHEISLVAGFPYDKYMYQVEGVPTNDLVYVHNSPNLIYRSPDPVSPRGYDLYIIRDFRAHLERVARDDLSVGYQLKKDSATLLLRDVNDKPLTVRAVTSSDDGQWLALELWRNGLALMNLKTYEVRHFSNYQPSFNVGMDGHIEFAVSNDGKFVATAGLNVDPSITEINGSCGKDLSFFAEGWVAANDNTIANPCPERQLYGTINTIRGGDLSEVVYPSFDLQGGEVTFYTRPYYRTGRVNQEEWVTLRATGYEGPKLAYLALGDSYSSGEGDTVIDPTTGGKYYRYLTDQEEDKLNNTPREKCHISTRAYPYLLAGMMQLPSENWNTVACSGAQTTDMNGNNDAYKGQNDNGIARLASYDYGQLKSQALNEFIPGRDQQIEFVKKYKPSVITLTAGGNDIGFGDIINACVNPTKEWTMVCSYASDDKMKAMLGSSIENLYPKLEKLYKDLYTASDDSAKIYVLGYPMFVNAESPDLACGLNVRLSQPERQMVQAAIIYLNSVIKAAAESAGVKYVDVQDSLQGHRLCDAGNDLYMTGLALWSKSEKQESFHPNAKGQGAIAHAVNSKLGSSLLDYGMCPTGGSNACPTDEATAPAPPAFFADAMQADDSNADYQKVVQGSAVVGGVIHITTDSFTFESDTPVNVILHSDPVTLGQYTASDDGILDVSVKLPVALTPGFHTLILTGKSYSGEPLTLFEVIEVTSSNRNDQDGDGVMDTKDPCLYVEPSGMDSDRDGVDDGCDPSIGTQQAGVPAPTISVIDTTIGGTSSTSNVPIQERGRQATSVKGGTTSSSVVVSVKKDDPQHDVAVLGASTGGMPTQTDDRQSSSPSVAKQPSSSSSIAWESVIAALVVVGLLYGFSRVIGRRNDR